MLKTGLFLLLIVLVAYPGIKQIPVSALVGVMFNVCFHTFEWSSLKLIALAAPLDSRLLEAVYRDQGPLFG